jgi:organic radical activating enzyme
MLEIAVNKIFFSIQGEGFHTGTPAVFIRTAGCNLACSWCDTDFVLKQKIPLQSIIQQIEEFPSKFVVLTGGEPTLQAESISKLVILLHKRSYYVALETNGTSLNTMGADWITVSPKLSQGGEWILKKGDELKLVYEQQDLSFFKDSQFTYYFLQPMEIRTQKGGAGNRDIARTREQWVNTVEAVINNPGWKLSFQIHKELGIP